MPKQIPSEEPTTSANIDHGALLIRPLSRPEDFHSLIQIWLESSIETHPFISESYWRSKAADICNIYLPAADTYMAVIEREIVGFYAIYQQQLAALFVKPEMQHHGIGTRLLEDAKERFASQWGHLETKVYSQNQRAVQFYLHHGFTIQNEIVEEATQEVELILCYHAADYPQD